MHAVTRGLVLVATLLVPAAASAAPPTATAKPVRTARVQKSAPRTCTRPAVEVVSGHETLTFSLTQCDGTVAPLAVDRLSVLARPASAARPTKPIEALGKSHGPELAPGVKRIDPRLVERLEQALDHFHKGATTAKVELVSGYRPKSAGSYHQSGRALDFRIDGVNNEELVAFCKTMPDTGCGYYPNSLFVHMDVRDKGAGHVAWIDVSRPGEAPKYVSAWPLPKGERGETSSKLPALPVDDQPGELLDAGPRRRDGHVYIF